MWKRVPRALAAAPALITRSEPWLEKLSSGRQAGGGVRRMRTEAAIQPQSTAVQRGKEVHCDPAQEGETPARNLTEPGTVSSCDGANSSFGKEIKIRKFQYRVTWAVGILLPNPAAVQTCWNRTSANDASLTRQHKETLVPLCHTAGWRCPPIALDSTVWGIVFQRKYLQLKNCFDINHQGQEVSQDFTTEDGSVASRGQWRTVRTLLALHSWRDFYSKLIHEFCQVRIHLQKEKQKQLYNAF